MPDQTQTGDVATGTTTTTDAADTASDNGIAQKLYTKEQLTSRIQREVAKATQKAEAERISLQEELEEIRQQFEAASGKKDDTKKHELELKKYQRQFDEQTKLAQKLQADLDNYRKKDSITQAIGKRADLRPDLRQLVEKLMLSEAVIEGEQVFIGDQTPDEYLASQAPALFSPPSPAGGAGTRTTQAAGGSSPTLTMAQIETFRAQGVLKQKMTDPEFRKAVEALQSGNFKGR